MESIPVSQITPNPKQPRHDFDQAGLDELANSIAIHGLITPITVEQLAPDRYQLIAGERRLRAVKQLGWLAIPAYIRNINGAGDRQRAELAITENLQRSDLNPIERALAYQDLHLLGRTYAEIAQAVGISPSSIPVYIQLLSLPAHIQNLYAQRLLPFDNYIVRYLPLLPEETANRLADRWAFKNTPVKAIINTIKKYLAKIDQPAEESPSVSAAPQPQRSNIIAESRTSAGGHWNMLAQLHYAGKTYNPAYTETARQVCRACMLYEDASSNICRDCPAVELLARLP